MYYKYLYLRNISVTSWGNSITQIECYGFLLLMRTFRQTALLCDLLPYPGIYIFSDDFCFSYSLFIHYHLCNTEPVVGNSFCYSVKSL
jgi:hypothetical protein